MKNSHTAWVVFRRIISLLFILFVVLYFHVETGSNNTLKEKTIITQENIKKFEEDIKNGEYVDIKDYTESSNIDTSNIMSDAGYLVSNQASKVIGKYLVDFFDFIGKLVK